MQLALIHFIESKEKSRRLKNSQILKITEKKQLKCKTKYLKEKRKINKQKENDE